MRNIRRIGAMVLCVLFVLVLSVSSTLIAHEADHDCIGEDCPICRMIAVNAEFLRLIGCVLVVLMAALLLTQAQSVRRFMTNRRDSASGTLISWKIRLND